MEAPTRVSKDLVSAWYSWCNRVHLHPRYARIGKDRVQHYVETRLFPPPPVPWALQEESLRAFGKGKVLARDDKDSTRVWSLPASTAYLKLLHDIISDANWMPRSDLSRDCVKAYMFARSLGGLPAFLRRARGTVSLPNIFFQIKAK